MPRDQGATTGCQQVVSIEIIEQQNFYKIFTSRFLSPQVVRRELVGQIVALSSMDEGADVVTTGDSWVGA